MLWGQSAKGVGQAQKLLRNIDISRAQVTRISNDRLSLEPESRRGPQDESESADLQARSLN